MSGAQSVSRLTERISNKVLNRYFPITCAHGTTDYLFYVGGKAAEFAKSTGSAV